MKPFFIVGPLFALLPKGGNRELLQGKGALPIVDLSRASCRMRPAIAKAHNCVVVEGKKLTGGRHF